MDTDTETDEEERGRREGSGGGGEWAVREGEREGVVVASRR